MFFTILSLFFLQLAIVSAFGQAFDRKAVFAAEEMVLDNGLKVIVVENHRAPVAAQMIWYGVGSVDEAAGHSGLAHYLEHLMFKGSDGLQPGQFSQEVRRLGGRDNAFTSRDYTAYFQQVPIEGLEKVMAMEAGRMRGLNPPQDHVSSELEVVMQERRQVLDSNPLAQLGERMRHALFVNHPYGRPIIGWMDEIKTLDWPTVKAFYDRFYRPDNAVLIITGAVSAEQGFALARKHYGDIPRIGDMPSRVAFAIPDSRVSQHLILRDATVQQPVWMIRKRAASLAQDKPTALALSIISDWLSGVEGPLYQTFVVEQNLAAAIDFSYSPLSRSDASWSVSVWPAAGKTAEDLNTALTAFFQGLKIDEATLQRVIMRMQDAAVWERDSLIGPAMSIGHVLASGGSLEMAEYWPYELEALSVDQVNAVIKSAFNIDHGVVTGWLQGVGE